MFQRIPVSSAAAACNLPEAHTHRAERRRVQMQSLVQHAFADAFCVSIAVRQDRVDFHAVRQHNGVVGAKRLMAHHGD